MGGGATGIRTLETVSRLHTFQACAFDHSATAPLPRGVTRRRQGLQERNCQMTSKKSAFKMQVNASVHSALLFDLSKAHGAYLAQARNMCASTRLQVQW